MEDVAKDKNITMKTTQLPNEERELCSTGINWAGGGDDCGAASV